MLSRFRIPQVQLNSGYSMPVIGMGTSARPLPPPETLVSIFLDAIESGYRHFDTAALYGSESSLGRAVIEAIDRGLIKSRDEMFITSKLWCTDTHPDLVLSALNQSLQRLGLEYLDLYLIHMPIRLKQAADGNIEPPDKVLLPIDIEGTWKAMEECWRLGLCKSIGVSNFGPKKLSQLLEHATIPPAVNQIELNAAWHQKELLEFCRGKGIRVSAWSPLGANGAYWGSLAVMESPILQEIAIAKGKTLAQIALRWVYEKGATVIVKSFNKERMKVNLDLFDWELSDEDKQKIDQIPQQRGFSGELFTSQHGPYKSVEEFWA